MVGEKIPRRAQVINAYKNIFMSPPGKTILHDLMNRFHVVGSTFDPNPREHARMEGERNVVLHILSLLNYDEKALLKEIEEANKPEET